MSAQELRIAIVGTGRVGLVAGAAIAERGHRVICVDRDGERVARLREGEVLMHEPLLEEMVRRNLAGGRLSFETDLEAGMARAEIVFLTVGTPHREENGAADLSAVDDAAYRIARALTGFTVIAIKSTVPVGTTERVAAIIAAGSAHPFAIASNPEFMREGEAVNDFLCPDRVIIGADDERAASLLRGLYSQLTGSPERILMMDIRSAELTKYAANAMLAVRLSFMNEIALLAELAGADIEKIRAGVGGDSRIGACYLSPGPGFGGSCLPKDLHALAYTASVWGTEMAVVNAASRTNLRQKHLLGARIKAHFGPSLSRRRIGVWGLSFKPETDDIRESPAIPLIEDLLAAGAHVVGYDPAAMPAIRAHFGDRVELAPDMYTAARTADGLAIVTDWSELRCANLGRLKEEMRVPAIFDGRNLWEPEALRHLGFHYYGIGRGSSSPAPAMIR